MPHEVKMTKKEAMEMASWRLEVSSDGYIAARYDRTHDRVGACTSSIATIGSVCVGRSESSMSSPVVATDARDPGTGREVVDAAGGVCTDGAAEADARDAIDVVDSVAAVRAGRADTDAMEYDACVLPSHGSWMKSRRL